MYKVEIINKDEMSFTVKSKGHEFVVDLKGSGITPPDTLLAGLGSCLGVYVRKYVEGAKLAVKDFTITVEADFGKEPPMAFRQISVAIDLKGADIDERRKKALIEFVKNCPVHNTLKAGPEISIRCLS